MFIVRQRVRQQWQRDRRSRLENQRMATLSRLSVLNGNKGQLGQKTKSQGVHAVVHVLVFVVGNNINADWYRHDQ